MFTRSTILDFTGKKLALSFIAHELVDGQRPPTSTSRPPDVIHVMGFPRDVSRSYYQSSNPIGQHFIHKVYVHM